MEKKANVIWNGPIKEGKGLISTESGILKNAPYGFATRFEGQPGTNPEELIAAAHASCFAMATSAALTKGGFPPRRLDVNATVTLQKEGEGWAVTASRLEMVADVPEIEEGPFRTLTEDAKVNCPISKLLKAEITLDAKLEGAGKNAELGF
jgi:osmotically inducible protein OsmC